MDLVAMVKQMAPGMQLYEKSITETDAGVTYFLARHGGKRYCCSIGAGELTGQRMATVAGKPVIAAADDADAAAALRKALPWTAPRCAGLAAGAGLGDRLGLATPGHVRAVRGSGLVAFLAQQSIREMTRTDRTPRQVMDCATLGVFQEGYDEGFGSDADHLQKPEDIDVTVAAGFTMFTIDPGAHVDNDADTLDESALTDRLAALDFETLAASLNDLKAMYAGKEFALEGGMKISLDDESFARAAVKYGRAVAHTVKMYRHLEQAATGEFELEVSVDETESPTSTAEHYFFAAELKRLGVRWVSMAPRFIGRFEKGVDYIGDLDALGVSLAEHVAVMRTLGPYKMSIHSGSDKFSVYPIFADLAGPLVHLKTAGTSYLEALRAIAVTDPRLYREVLDFARGRYETDKATYHVSADVSKVPPGESVADDRLAALLDDFDARQVLHVTFGSVLTAEGGGRFGGRIRAALASDEEAHYAALEKHLRRHVEPFRQAAE